VHLPVVIGPDGQKLSKQTGAAPVRDDRPLASLSHAMQFLGHPVPEVIQQGNLQNFWDWAIANWSLSQVPNHVPALPSSTGTHTA